MPIAYGSPKINEVLKLNPPPKKKQKNLAGVGSRLMEIHVLVLISISKISAPSTKKIKIRVGLLRPRINSAQHAHCIISGHKSKCMYRPICEN